MLQVYAPKTEDSILRPLKIGSLKIPINLVLAPMAGVANSAFRCLLRQENPGAVGLVLTELISVEGLSRQHRGSLDLLRFAPQERPIAIQLFGANPLRVAEAAQLAQDAGADMVDINCGCPVPKVVKRGGGCELMRQPVELGHILRAVRKVLQVPLSIKIRAGWNRTQRNAVEIATLAEDCGVDLLSIHGRTRDEGYQGKADWALIDEVARAVKIPVLGNGDVVDLQTARKALCTAVSGVMIGRGALANPWLFTDIEQEDSGKAHSPRLFAERCRFLLAFDQLMTELHPSQALGYLKQCAARLLRGSAGISELRHRLCASKSLTVFREQLNTWPWQERVD